MKRVMRRFDSKRCAGFSLIEMVVAITVLGVLSGSAAVFLRGPITSYFDTERRVDLSDAGGLAMEKLTQDIARAEPANNVNVTVAGASGFPLTFVPRLNPAQPITYSCVASAINPGRRDLRRNPGNALLATNLVTCQARRFPAAGTPARWVTLVLGFDSAGDRLTLYHTIRIDLP
ncbi:prepilin-type N-terminal cleavage/methylation domain-containing protein [Thiobacillus sp.]|uniref:prepilin-type N-terminal cleavage/methylation domain-containing protein n=1 Tax=Thiobacillus sp. TaxID=924 RepID=UPI0025E49932|nr:prepilin-type N-terminal cleavage/methylation domain-containing protein [Thiobacillus sp.]MBT9540410.1 prepilin-type N-terminal cleavage/methylation domain-containing protein [Thiobacillus sp.]